MKIFSGRNYQSLTDEICNHLNYEFDLDVQKGNLQIDKFSDGEILPLFRESVRNKHIYFINSTSSSDEILETFLVMDAAMRSGCKRFTLASPFMGYSRQDKTDHLRSSIGAKMLANLIESFGQNGMKIDLITIDLHAPSIQGFYNIPVIHLNGNKIFIDHIRTMNIENLCIVAPDQGAVKRASDFCKAFPEASFAMINKKRVKPNEIHSMELVGDVSGKNVLIVDDIADTLGTMRKASELLFENGATTVMAAATHGVFSGKAFLNLGESNITKFLTSDSIASKDISQYGIKEVHGYHKVEYVSCARLIAKSIKALNKRESINELNTI
jgi:ribose-phosphate pyrophosphokinase